MMRVLNPYIRRSQILLLLFYLIYFSATGPKLGFAIFRLLNLLLALGLDSVGVIDFTCFKVTAIWKGALNQIHSLNTN